MTNPPVPPADTDDVSAPSRLAHLYTVLADLLRDQVASQLETASTNDLKSVGVLAAALAVVVSLLLLRAADPHGIGYWWWYPLPLFVVPGVLAAMPLRPPTSTVRFLDGPSVPRLVTQFERGRTGDGSEPFTLEEQLVMVLRGLHTSWSNNDRLLAAEGRSFYWGILTLAIATLITLGLYAWGLS